MIIQTGKIRNWVDTKSDLRNITAATPGADVGVYENMCIYQFVTPNIVDDDNDNYIRLSSRTQGYWEKKVSLNMNDVRTVFAKPLIIKGYANTSTSAENGDWMLSTDASNNLYLKKYKASSWVNYEKYSY